MSIENKFTIRKKCIFCSNDLHSDDEFFKNDLKNFVAHYGVDKKETNFDLVPYNIFICSKCKTAQMKYLGNIDEVYKINHADGTGSTMQNMHEKKLELILKYSNDINGIIEIGSSKGILADLILEKIDIDYNIIEPSYFGTINKKNIICDYYENVDDGSINSNTIIMSHVFEHFYNPLEILNKIKNNSNIENIFLTFPNLEKYISEDIHHVLNTEHTYYIDNDFIKDLFKFHGFELVEIDFYKSHSVFFYFKRNKNIDVNSVKLFNKKNDISVFFDKIYKIVDTYNKIIENNKDKNVYLFPASCHSIFLSIFGLNYKLLAGMLDNSPNKIGKKVYGLNLEIFSFGDIIKNNESIILINGGVFNSEVEQKLIDNHIEYYSI